MAVLEEKAENPRCPSLTALAHSPQRSGQRTLTQCSPGRTRPGNLFPNVSDVNSPTSATKASFPSAWHLRLLPRAGPEDSQLETLPCLVLSWRFLEGQKSRLRLQDGFFCTRKKMLKIQITTLLCGSHSASPCFSHATLHSSGAPLAFFLFEHQTPCFSILPPFCLECRAGLTIT